MKKLYCFLVISLFFSFSAIAVEYKNSDKKSEFVIKGTSTLHDWDSKVTKSKVDADLEILGKDVTKINHVSYSMQAKDIKSGEDGMDDKIYEALKTEKFKDITFKMTVVESLKNNKFVIKGKLKIAGVEKEIKLEGEFSKVENKSLHVTGSHQMKMTDFNVEPPSALLVITSGDDITLSFDLLMETK